MRARLVILLGACSIAVFAHDARAQVPGQNVNMVAGTTWPLGDPFLQRQNEPSMAVSSRNPLHLLAGANDYRTVDLPGLPGGEVTGDAWLGLFKSTNGGGRWTSTLVPGYPQDMSPEGLASPLKGFQAGADAFVRPGSHGLMYYSGLAFNRGEGQPSAIFVARYQDRNNKENGDPFQYLGTSIVARNAPGDFLDKPTLAVDIPRANSGVCGINGVPTPAGAVYAAWTVFLGDDHPHGKKDKDDDDEDEGEQGSSPIRSRIVFARSLDCGATWSKPVTLSDSRTNQAASIAIDPRNGTIYVAWRQFSTWHFAHAIKIAKSTDGGRTFSFPIPIWGFFSFDQGTTGTSFRTNSYPTVAVDHNGRVYVAWSARGYAAANPNVQTGDTRIVMSTSTNGWLWTFPRAVDNFPGRGHQIMPALSYAGGKLQLVYYDLREDVSGFFEQYVDEFNILRLPPGTPGKRRHTTDVRSAQADPATHPRFTSYAVTPVDPSQEASRYMIGSRPGSAIIEQLQFNPPNLPLFGLGTVPFIGDYIDVAAQTIVPPRPGEQRFRFSGPTDAPVFHMVWADNRDVRPPLDGDWSNYTPPTFSGSGGPSIFDPTQTARACVPGQAGMRNQNLYTSRVSPGLVAGSPGNAKGLSTDLPRAFVVFAQNTTSELALYRFSIRNQPPGGVASFEQFALLTQVEVLVPPGSSAARTVNVTSTDPRASVIVDIVQIAGAGVPPPPPEGRSSTVVLNPDISNPDISNPDISNPDISNPDISNAEVHNPDISNPDISNPDISNPDISNPDISNPDISNIEVANPDISNPDISNPDISNPDISNPDISNPDISNPDISNGSISDYSYEVTNNGNTASEYTVETTETNPLPGSIKLQLVIHRIYQTPVVDGCTLKLQTQNQVLLNLPNPLDFTGRVTFWLEPGETIKLTYRVIDTNRSDDITFDPRRDLDIDIEAEVVNWDSEEGPDETPSSDSATPPVARDDEFSAARGQLLTVPAPGVLANDTVSEEDEGVVELVSDVESGQLTLNPDGSFSYQPGESDGDSFQYRIAGGLLSNVATVTISISGGEVNPLVVSNTNDEGPGSLRSAILFANLNPNPSDADVITFAIPGTGVHRILPATLLPPITDPVAIDGTTQPGYEGTPLVVIDGSNIDIGEEDGGYGLALGQPGASIVRGLSIVNTPGKGIVLISDENLVQSNWIGVDAATGEAGPTQEAGVAVMNGAAGNIIGVDCPLEGPCLSSGANLISGNAGAGVYIYDGDNTRVRGNRIGTTPNGLAALPNGEGVGISEGSSNQIGGVRGGEGNLISGNLGAGVALRLIGESPTETLIAGNFIGVSATGGPLGNGSEGVLLQDVAGVTVRGNVISNNTRSGMTIFGGGGNHTIGGLEQGEGNVIAENGDKGITLFTLGGPNALPPLGNRILSNNIFGNETLAIDLDDNGETPNDGSGDEDFGANRRQNYPVVTFRFGENQVFANVDLLTSPGTFTIQLFMTRGGCGGPKTLVDTRSIATNVDGFGNFIVAVPLAPGDAIWPTATNNETGDTSETRCFVMSPG
jgi:hypothetical protein